MDAFPIVETRAWERLAVEDMGTKAKVWLVDPDGWRWLFKQNRSDDQGERGEDWSEKIAAEVAVVLGVPAAVVELAEGEFVQGPPTGVISRHILQERAESPLEGDLVHGNELLAGQVQAYPMSERGALEAYTLERCHSVLEPYWPSAASRAPADATAWFDFVGQLLLDVLIANTDRHHENWAVIERSDGRVSMAPSFDHASSLGFNVRQAEKQRRLESQSVRAWTGRGRTKFAGRPTMVQAARTALRMLPAQQADFWQERLATLDVQELTSIVDTIPGGRMSHTDRRFASMVMRLNLEEVRHGN